MISATSRLLAGLVCSLSAVLACSSSEPNDGTVPLPELVYAERDETTGLWSVYGYTGGEGSREIVPGPLNLPRASYGTFFVRPTTGELLYPSADPGSEGYLLANLKTGAIRRLTIPGEVQDWSPSGDLLTIYNGTAHQVVTVEGAVRSTLCSEPLVCGVVDWAPTSDAVVGWQREETELPDLWRWPLSAGPPVNLTATADATEIGASHSPDGEHIAYLRNHRELVVINADGSEPRQMLALAGLGNFPWAPDGSAVAVDGEIGGQTGLAVVPLAGEPRLVTPPGERLVVVSQISWSPDGNRLLYSAFDGTPSDVPGVFLINLDGSGRRQLSTPGNPTGNAAWMPILR